MLSTRLPPSSAKQSKRFRRRLRTVFDKITTVPEFRGGFTSHVFTVFLFILFIFLINNLFSIRTVICTLDNQPCPPEVMERFVKFEGSNVLLLNQKQLAQSLKSSFPIQKVSIGFKIFNKLNLELEGGNPPINAAVFLVKDFPILSIDTAPGSSESAGWPKPSLELSKFIEVASSSAFSLWDTGLMTPIATDESKIKYIISEKPSDETVKSIYSLVKLVNKYLDIQSIQIIGQRVFLSQSNQPDIIVSVPFNEGQVSEAIKSFTYLTSIKKDAKVIDLRFKNPIIR